MCRYDMVTMRTPSLVRPVRSAKHRPVLCTRGEVDKRLALLGSHPRAHSAHQSSRRDIHTRRCCDRYHRYHTRVKNTRLP